MMSIFLPFRLVIGCTDPDGVEFTAAELRSIVQSSSYRGRELHIGAGCEKIEDSVRLNSDREELFKGSCSLSIV